MAQQWRLLLDGKLDGARNMAVDRAIQQARQEGGAPPTLRLYGWSVPTLTLGRFQTAQPEVLERCAQLGVDVVRRPTGGRGVIHDDEVTYSVVASLEDGVPRGTAASYRYLCAGIVECYRELGVEAALTARERGDRDSSACYLHATEADVSAGLAKLSGSAQVWYAETCLQHGSFTRTRDIEREREVFGLGDEQIEQLQATTATLGDLLCDVPDEQRIEESAVDGFSRALGIELRSECLTSAEVELAEEIEAELVAKMDERG